MKSKNIPADIKAKSIKEAQTEIKEIISFLERNTASLEESIDSYNRMILLNDHIQTKFKEKASEINKLNINENKKDPDKRIN